MVAPQTPSSDKPDAPLSVKQERDRRRAEKVAAVRKREATQRRNRVITTVAASAAAAGVLALIIVPIVTSAVPEPDPSSISIEGVETWDSLSATHVETESVDYETAYDMNPPAGGDHFAAWLNCGVYTEEQQNENAVHALEHGAVWITYDPDAVSDADLETLQNSVPSTYIVLSPYPDLPAPVVASAWAAQVQLEGVDDPRLADFITKYWQSPSAPEPGAACVGGIDGPGKVA